jgi:pimeloyl-ACP methyl ester carboxylesterase
MPSGVEHRSVTTNGISMHIAEQGEGPLVLLCHGWPELTAPWQGALIHQPTLFIAGTRDPVIGGRWARRP